MQNYFILKAGGPKLSFEGNHSKAEFWRETFQSWVLMKNIPKLNFEETILKLSFEANYFKEAFLRKPFQNYWVFKQKQTIPKMSFKANHYKAEFWIKKVWKDYLRFTSTVPRKRILLVLVNTFWQITYAQKSTNDGELANMDFLIPEYTSRQCTVWPRHSPWHWSVRHQLLSLHSRCRSCNVGTVHGKNVSVHIVQYVCMENGSRGRLNFHHISWCQEQIKAEFTYGIAALRIRDIHPGSRIRIFSIPDPHQRI